MLSDPIDNFKQVLQSQGVAAALRFLNARAPHRFTGVFRFEPPFLRNLYLADAWDPAAAPIAPAPLEQTFCGLVGRTRQPFLTPNMRVDPRLEGHPLRHQSVESYCGVLVRDQKGQAVGSLCHFDTQPCDIAVQELEFLEAAADILSRELNPLSHSG